MKTVRFGVFETNSSSTHSLIMCSEEDYDKFKKGELVLDSYNDELIEPEDKDLEEDYRYKTYDEYQEHDNNLESYYQEYTTKSGEKIIAFGEFGYDG